METIPKKITEQAAEAVRKFNEKQFLEGDMEYLYTIDGKYVYLKMRRKKNISPIARIEFTGDPKAWKFAVYNPATESFSENTEFPGVEYIDGSIEGAMKAGVSAFYG
jgi:hypothetical protein